MTTYGLKSDLKQTRYCKNDEKVQNILSFSFYVNKLDKIQFHLILIKQFPIGSNEESMESYQHEFQFTILGLQKSHL